VNHNPTPAQLIRFYRNELWRVQQNNHWLKQRIKTLEKEKEELQEEIEEIHQDLAGASS